jgi:hypothetical protein
MNTEGLKVLCQYVKSTNKKENLQVGALICTLVKRLRPTYVLLGRAGHNILKIGILLPSDVVAPAVTTTRDGGLTSSPNNNIGSPVTPKYGSCAI